MASKQREITRIIEKLESKQSLLEASIFESEEKLKDVRWKITQEYTIWENLKFELKNNTQKNNNLYTQIDKLNKEIQIKQNKINQLDINFNNLKQMESDLYHSISLLKTDLINKEEKKIIIINIIDSLNSDINKKKEEIENLSVQLWLYTEDLHSLKNTISEKKEVLQNIKKEYTEVDNNRQILDKKESDLIIRERNISLKEKRLNDLEQKLFSNK